MIKIQTIICMAMMVFAFQFLSKDAEAKPGTLDPKFGKNGELLNQFKFAFGYIPYQLKDSSLLMAGDEYIDKVGFRPSMFKMSERGVRDSGFLTIDVPKLPENFENWYTTDCLIQSSGRIVLVGWLFNNGTNERAGGLIGYLPNGDLDSSFGWNGMVIFRKSEKIILPGKGVVSTNDSILVSANIRNLDNDIYKETISLFKFDIDGNKESGYGKNGEFEIKSKLFEYAHAGTLSIDSNGDFWIGGDRNPHVYPQGDIVQSLFLKFDSSGFLDLNFGDNGVSVLPRLGNDPSKSSWTSATAVQGKNLVALINEDFTGTLVRILPNGSIDQNFGQGGRSYPFKSIFETCVKENCSDPGWVTIQSDQKILVTGFKNSRQIIRLSADGLPDTGFGNIGNGGFYLSVSNEMEDFGHILPLKNGNIFLSARPLFNSQLFQVILGDND